MRDLLLGAIDIAVIVTPLSCLWLIVRRARRRAERIADQLAGPIVPTGDLLLVKRNRRVALAWAVLFVLFGPGMAAKAGSYNLALGIAAGVALVTIFFVHVQMALQRRPVLELDGDGMRITPSGKVIPWTSVEDLWIEEARAVFGLRRHTLRCDYYQATTATPGHTGTGIDLATARLPLETLSTPWNDVVSAIQVRFGGIFRSSVRRRVADRVSGGQPERMRRIWCPRLMSNPRRNRYFDRTAPRAAFESRENFAGKCEVRWSPKPQREVRLLGPPFGFMEPKTGPMQGFRRIVVQRPNSAGHR